MMDTMSGSNKVIAGAKYIAAGTEISNSSNYALRIIITPNQFIYLVAEQESKRVIQLIPFQFTKISSPDEWIREIDVLLENYVRGFSDFAERKIGIFTPFFTLVPAPLDAEHTRRQLLSLNVTTAPDHVLRSDNISSQNIHLVYALPNNLLQKLTTSGIEVRHALSGLLESVMAAGDRSGNKQLFVYVQPGSFQLIYIKDNALKLCNSFSYQSAEDFVYHLLFTCKQLHLDPELIPVTLMGEILRDSSLYQLLYKYVRKIEFASFHKNWQFDQDYPLSGHFFYNLFCI